MVPETEQMGANVSITWLDPAGNPSPRPRRYDRVLMAAPQRVIASSEQS